MGEQTQFPSPCRITFLWKVVLSVAPRHKRFKRSIENLADGKLRTVSARGLLWAESQGSA